MKSSTSIIVIVAALAMGWGLATVDRAWRSGSDAKSYRAGLTIEQVQALSCLVTTRVEVADVQETRLDGYTGSVKAALLLRGDFLLGVDLAQAKFESVNETARTATLVLPQPHVASPRLDHERTRVFAVLQTGLWQIAPGGGQTSGEVVDRAYRDAQRFVAAAADDPAMIARSRQQAEQVLAAFFKATGWTVTVKWQS